MRVLFEEAWPTRSVAEIVIKVGDGASLALDYDETRDEPPCLSIQDGPVQVMLYPLAWLELGHVDEADLELAGRLVIEAVRWRDAIFRRLEVQRAGPAELYAKQKGADLSVRLPAASASAVRQIRPTVSERLNDPDYFEEILREAARADDPWARAESPPSLDFDAFFARIRARSAAAEERSLWPRLKRLVTFRPRRSSSRHT